MMRIKSKRVLFREVFLWLALVLGILSSSLSSVRFNTDKIVSACKLGMTAFIVIGIFAQRRFNKRVILFDTILIAATVLSYFTNGIDAIVYMIVLILLASKIDKEKIVTVYGRTLCISIIVIFLFSLFSGLPISMVSKGRFAITGGFLTANTFATFVMKVFLSYLCVNYEKKKTENIVLSVLLALLTYFLTACSTVTIIYIIVFILLIYSYRNDNAFRSKAFSYIIALLPLVLTVLSFILKELYRSGTTAGIMINQFLSNRLYFINYFTDRYKITLTGNNMSLITGAQVRQQNLGWLGLDNSYVYLILGGGIILYAITYLFYFLSIKEMQRRRNNGALIVALSFVLYGLTENGWYNIWINFTFFFASFEVIKRWLMVKKRQKNHAL